MQIFFKHRNVKPMFVDHYLEELDEVKDMEKMGLEVHPYDENDVIVPIDKNTPKNLEMVEESMAIAYGHKHC